MTSTITLSTRLPSGEGHETIIRSKNFKTKDNFANYALNILSKQHNLSPDSLRVFKTYLTSRCDRITYCLSTDPGISYIEKSEPFFIPIEIPEIQETAKKVCKAVSTARDLSEKMQVFNFAKANKSTDFVLKAFFHSSDFETITLESITPNIKTTYSTLLSSDDSDDGELSSEDDDTVLV